jgi:hypothetical protein
MMKKLVASALAALTVIGGSKLRAEEPPKDGGSVALAMVVLRDPVLPDADRIADYIRSRWPDAPVLGASEIKDDTIFFGFKEDNGTGSPQSFVSFMPAPIPQEELEFPCETALTWDDACEELKTSKAHLIVSVMGGSGTAVDRHIQATMLVQACLELTNGLGVYWGSAASVWSAKQFKILSSSLTRGEPPYLIWMGLKVSKDEGDTVTVLTSGLSSFGVMDVEVQRSRKPANDVFELVGDIAIYLIKSGAVVKDGDTVGHTMNEKIKVTHSPSLTDAGKTVYRLHY